ncbi:MAG: FKBP-type peptidyl-prolyl cis-trans isomerase [Bacteroidales bacterium]|nr:FKBP-type peptidyl-prolyl cis-trans isomerase [Bacteroidales bacterium]
MKIKSADILFLLIICMMTASSCVKEKLETIYQKQESQIDSYLSKNNTAKRDSTIIYEDGTKKDTTWTEELQIVYNRGAARLVKKKGSGPKLAADGAVSFYYAGYIFKGSAPTAANLFATNHQTTAETSEFEVTDADYSLFEANMAETELLEGLRAGLEGVSAGEECEILFTAKYGYGNRTFGIIPVNSALLYRIWVVGVSND